jgi:ABC-2 type transport system ATP-binding protein
MELLTVSIISAGYEEREEVIRNIDFSIKKGELVGMIGSNGAGKSTTIKTVLGQLSHYKGTINFHENEKYAYIPERPIYYDELTLWEHIEFIGGVEEIPYEKLQKRGTELLKKYRLLDVAHQLPSSFSKGMQQKGMIVLALLTNPRLLIIDEPFIGLDPNATKLMLSSLEEMQKSGTGILMCTHVLDTAQRVCDRFIVIEKGTRIASGTLSEVLKECGVTAGGTLYDCIPEEGVDLGD